MTASTIWRAAMLVAALKSYSACGQWSFYLDTSFVSAIVQRNANSLLLADDGRLVVSGIMRFSEELPATDYSLARLNADGTWDQTFFTSGYGGGRLNAWQPDRFYVRGTYTPRRVWSATGQSDNSFAVGVGVVPYFLPTVGGDFHVYPDGSVVISGTHTLSDTARGFVGQYRLVWFSNEGYLDTTRTHRQANGPIWEFKELPDGKFICTCSCTQYEGQPVSRVFRVHADGSLDTTFQSTINAGNIYEIEPLPDGKVLLGGNFRFTGAPQDTVRLARLHADGTRDTAFASLAFAGNGSWWSPSGTIVFDIFPFHGSNHIIAGQFTSVNGELRKGLCMVDEDGNLLDAFDECGVGPFTYQGSTNATPLNVYWNQDSTAIYICGAYAGYDDGNTNDPDQRFVSRLLVSELSVGVEQHGVKEPPATAFGVYPNPARDQVLLRYDFGDSATTTSAVLRDAVGRIVATIPLDGTMGQKAFDVAQLTPGTYLIQYFSAVGLAGSVPLVVQQ